MTREETNHLHNMLGIFHTLGHAFARSAVLAALVIVDPSGCFTLLFCLHDFPEVIAED